MFIRLGRSYEEYVEDKERRKEKPLSKREWLALKQKKLDLKDILSKASKSIKDFALSKKARDKMLKGMADSIRKNAPKAKKALWEGFKGEAKAIAVEAPSILYKIAREKRKPTRKEMHTLYGVGVYVAGTALAFSGATPLLSASKAFAHSITLHAAFKAIHNMADEFFLGAEAIESLITGVGGKLPVTTSDIPGLNHIFEAISKMASTEEDHFKDVVERMYDEVATVIEKLDEKDVERIFEHARKNQ